MHAHMPYQIDGNLQMGMFFMQVNTHTHTHMLTTPSSSTSQTHYWQQFSDGCVTASTADLLLERALPISAGLITLMYAHPDT